MTSTPTTSTTGATPIPAPRAAPPAPRGSGLLTALGDGWTIAKRNLIKIKRIPDLLIYTTIQPIMFVVLFAYVFGGAIAVQGGNYREFLIGGVFTQTVAFGSAFTAVGLADDLQKGIIDRFRSLPMARSAVLVGRTTSDLVNNVITVVVMSLTGLLVGWRIREGLLSALGAYALLLLFAFAMSWVSALIGLSVRSVEVAQSAGFIWLFPVTFVSNAFVPLESFNDFLRPIAEWNPISAVTAGVRELFGNTNGAPVPGGFPLEHPVLYSVLWCLGLLAVFVPLSVRKYRSAATR